MTRLSKLKSVFESFVMRVTERSLKNLVPKFYSIYCNATCDGYLCWPPTPAGETYFQNCPKALLSNVKMCAFRRCGADGLWLGRHPTETSPKGWTNYTPCFPTLVQKILDKVNEDENEAQLKFETAVNTRTIEMVGIVSSFLTVCAAIIIFNAFPSLHNRRTLIHKNLFYALLMEVTVRMILYSQQSYSIDRVDPLEEGARRGIEYFPYVCEGAYVLLEYSRLVVYGWMFIEGIFLNTLISANALSNEIPINYFYIGGWGVSAIVIAIWATVVARHYSEESLNTCWYGYNYLPSYYIIQGPILAIVLLNILFLGTIMSVIIMKLRRTNDSELRKIQKTIRATLILLPLLGIINIFNLFDYPLDGSSTGFAIWAYFTHFFRSFQGVFISFIYCFSNGEVRKAIKKKFERRTRFRFGWLERRRRVLAHGNPRERPVFAITDNENMELVPVPLQTWSTHLLSDVDRQAGPSQVKAMTQRGNTSPTPGKSKIMAMPKVDISLNFGQPTTTPSPYVQPPSGNIHASAQAMPSKSKYKSTYNIQTTPDLDTQSSQDFEPEPDVPHSRPEVADAPTAALFKMPEVVDATTSLPLGHESDRNEQATRPEVADAATAALFKMPEVVDTTTSLPLGCESGSDEQASKPQVAHELTSAQLAYGETDSDDQASNQFYDSNFGDVPVAGYDPSCLLHNPPKLITLIDNSFERRPSIEPSLSAQGLPPFNRPPAVRKSKFKWFTKCVYGGNKEKTVKRSSSLEDTKNYVATSASRHHCHQLEDTPLRSGSGSLRSAHDPAPRPPHPVRKARPSDPTPANMAPAPSQIAFEFKTPPIIRASF